PLRPGRSPCPCQCAGRRLARECKVSTEPDRVAGRSCGSRNLPVARNHGAPPVGGNPLSLARHLVLDGIPGSPAKRVPVVAQHAVLLTQRSCFNCSRSKKLSV